MKVFLPRFISRKEGQSAITHRSNSGVHKVLYELEFWGFDVELEASDRDQTVSASLSLCAVYSLKSLHIRSWYQVWKLTMQFLLTCIMSPFSITANDLALLATTFCSHDQSLHDWFACSGYIVLHISDDNSSTVSFGYNNFSFMLHAIMPLEHRSSAHDHNVMISTVCVPMGMFMLNWLYILPFWDGLIRKPCQTF